MVENLANVAISRQQKQQHSGDSAELFLFLFLQADTIKGNEMPGKIYSMQRIHSHCEWLQKCVLSLFKCHGVIIHKVTITLHA